MNNNIFVSIICLTYNHEKYIKDALDGFVNQKTKYAYEIIIHDDCSTDNTASIIKEYCEKYPNLFVPIYEKENIYSQLRKSGRGLIKEICFPKVRGKYICFCEGDDYWNDPYLIEKKVNFLENHSEYCAYLHRTRYFDCENNSFIGYSNSSEEEYEFTFEDAIYLKSHTTGWMIRTEIYQCPISDKISFIRNFSDQKLALWSTFYGRVYYTPEVMSVWRKNVEGSWTKRNINGGKKQKISYFKKRNKFLKKLNKICSKKYSLFINKMIVQNKIKIAEVKNLFLSIYFWKIINKILYKKLNKDRAK